MAERLLHVATMYHHLVEIAGQRPFELEVSVDETEQPTSHAEHIYIASELKRHGRELGQPGAALCWQVRKGRRLYRES